MSEYQPLRASDGNNDSADPELAAADHGGAWKANVTELGKKFGELGGRLTESVGAVGDKMKEMFHQPSLGERLVEEATSEVLIGPDWSKNLQICDLVNGNKVPMADVIKGIKRRLAMRNGHVQLLALVLLETSLKNCSNVFPELVSEKLLDSMVRIVDDPTTASALREKCLRLIEAWGEATEELRYLPVFEETYKSLQNRGIVFPPRDSESLAPIFTPPASAAPTPAGEAAGAPAAAAQAPSYLYAPQVGVPVGVLTHGRPGGVMHHGVQQFDFPEGPVTVLDSTEILSVARNSAELLSTVLSSAPPEEALKDEVTLSLAAQCRASKGSVQRLAEAESTNETTLFEALAVNDELDKVLDKLAELRKQVGPTPGPPTGEVPAVSAPQVAPSTAEASSQLADLLAPPPPVTSLSVPLGAEGSAGAGPSRAAAGAAESEDDKALAELDAMVFGRASGSTAAAVAAPGSSLSTTATAATLLGGQGQGQEEDKKGKEDNMIVF